jgi:hypothetical protein
MLVNPAIAHAGAPAPERKIAKAMKRTVGPTCGPLGPGKAPSFAPTVSEPRPLPDAIRGPACAKLPASRSLTRWGRSALESSLGVAVPIQESIRKDTSSLAFGIVGRFGGGSAGFVVAALNAASAASREVVVLRVLSAGIFVFALGLHFPNRSRWRSPCSLSSGSWRSIFTPSAGTPNAAN